LRRLAIDDGLRALVTGRSAGVRRATARVLERKVPINLLWHVAKSFHLRPDRLEVIVELAIKSRLLSLLRASIVDRASMESISSLREHVPILTCLLQMLYTILQLPFLAHELLNFDE
jgi:hypothetical protein